MKVIVLVPKVVQNYINSFPETTQNAYKYFNYDDRVVDERAEKRFDNQVPFKGPEDLSNDDYDTIVAYAKTLMNPILMKYSAQVACEDALHMAIRSYDRGIYDGKINASKYEVLLAALKQPASVLAKEKAPKPEAAPKLKTIKVQVDPTTIPKKFMVKHKLRSDVPALVSDKGKNVIVNK